MSSSRKIYPILIAGALIAGAVYFVNARFLATPAEPPLAEAVNETTTEPATTTEETTASEASTEVPLKEAEAEVAQEQASPFAVVESDEDTDAENTSTENTDNTEVEVTSAVSVENNDAAQNSTAIIEVPQSYPIEDAEKYFIPKDQRGPGNIGGPPPLNFPGGPNDPKLKLPGQ